MKVSRKLVRQALAARPPRPVVTDEEREETAQGLICLVENFQADPRPVKVHDVDPDRPKFPTFRQWVGVPRERSRAPRVAALRSARPRERRESTHVAKATTGNDPGDEPSEPPAAALDAVAASWASILHRRAPAVAWEVRR